MTSFLSVVVPVSERRRFAPATLIHALRLKQSARVFSHLLQHLPKERETDRLRVSISINHLLSLSLSNTPLYRTYLHLYRILQIDFGLEVFQRFFHVFKRDGSCGDGSAGGGGGGGA